MRNRVLRMLALALLMVLAVSALPAMAAESRASIVTRVLYVNCGSREIEMKNWTWREEIVSVVSSRPQIIKVMNRKELWLTPKRQGQAKITVKYKLNGRTYSTSATYTVKRYPNAVRSLKVNGENIPLRGDDKVCFGGCLGEDAVTIIDLKPASGWSIAKIDAYYWNESRGTGPKTITVKNNKRFRIPKGCCVRVFYTLVNRRYGTFEYEIYMGLGE